MTKPVSWLMATCVVIGIFYISSDVLTPFVVSAILAYLVSPCASFLERKLRVSRWVIGLSLVALMVTIFILLWVTLFPIIYEQIISFIQSIPKYQIYLREHILPLAKTQLNKIDHALVKNVPQFLDNIFGMLLKNLAEITNRILRSWLVMVDILLTLILIPVFTFYFIKDWKVIGANIRNLVPHTKLNHYDRLMAQINITLSGLIRSQLTCCLILAIYYSIALSIIKVDFAVFIGITTGLLSFIPFVSVLSGFIASSISSYFTFDSSYGFIGVSMVFCIGVVIENIVSAALMSSKTGLHPLLLMFFILIGGHFFGLKGVLFAVPVGAITIVVAKFMLGEHRTKLRKA